MIDQQLWLGTIDERSWPKTTKTLKSRNVSTFYAPSLPGLKCQCLS
jgi:hypothetical protein